MIPSQVSRLPSQVIHFFPKKERQKRHYVPVSLPVQPSVALELLVGQLPEAEDDVVPDGRVLLEVEPGRADQGESHLAPRPVRGVPLGSDEVVGLLGPAAEGKQSKGFTRQSRSYQNKNTIISDTHAQRRDLRRS